MQQQPQKTLTQTHKKIFVVRFELFFPIFEKEFATIFWCDVMYISFHVKSVLFVSICKRTHSF